MIFLVRGESGEGGIVMYFTKTAVVVAIVAWIFFPSWLTYERAIAIVFVGALIDLWRR